MAAVIAVQALSPTHVAYSAIRVDGVILTDGISYGGDSVVDSPSSYGSDTGLGGEVRGNYATLNPLTGSAALAGGNLESSSSSAWQSRPATISVNSGKWYAESYIKSGISTSYYSHEFGVTVGSDNAPVVSDYLGSKSYGYAILVKSDVASYMSNGSYVTTASGTYANGDVMKIAVDVDAGKGWLGVNNSWLGGGNPATGTSPTFTFSASNWVMMAASNYLYSGVSGVSLSNFGQTAFKYSAPSGFKALVDTNLPTPAVVRPNTVFDAVTYSGSGSTQDVIMPGGFSPDFVWIKNRSVAGASHTIFDTIRGVMKRLASDKTNVEDTQSGVTSFNANGFTTGSFTSVSGSNYIAWAWNAGTSFSTNTNGSISSYVRTNSAAGISVVGYSYNATSGTVGHGLGAVPHLILEKSRDQAYNWLVYHKDLGATKVMRMSQASAATTETEPWNNTAPTNTVFSVGPSSWNGGNNVAYCFVSVPGFSKIGSYVGNSSDDGPFIYTGFRPKFILMKRTDSAEPWVMRDTARDRYNGLSYELYANTDGAESGPYATPVVDYLANGFKLRSGTASASNAGTIIYAAFAENPFQYARAR